MMISRALYRYRSRTMDQAPLIARIREIAAARVRYGYQRIHVLLRREGWQINRKRVYRLYRMEGLSLYQRRPRRSRAAQQRQGHAQVTAISQCWSMDFVSDQLYDGRKLRALTLIDTFTRECLSIWVDQSLRGHDVVNVLSQVRQKRGSPQRIQVDNGPEFVSKTVDRWAYEQGVQLAFSRPGKPTDNAHIEAFNGRLRQRSFGRQLIEPRVAPTSPSANTPASRNPRISFRTRLSPTRLATRLIRMSWLTRSKNFSRSRSTTHVYPSSIYPCARATAICAERPGRKP